MSLLSSVRNLFCKAEEALPSGWQPLFNDNENEKPMPEETMTETEEQQFLTYPIPPDRVINSILDPDAKTDFSVFKRIIGQEKAKRRLARAAFQAWRHKVVDLPSGPESDHLFTTNILLEGSTSTGKTTLTRVFVQDGLRLPLCEINGAKIKSATEILYEVAKTLLSWDANWRARGGDPQKQDPIGLTLVEESEKQFYLPPMVLFVDEAHRLPKALQELLLKAVEPNDRVLQTENGATINCERVAWIFATTNRGQLLDTLDNRFRKVKLRLYSREEIARIVQLDHANWHISLCRLIAHYVPRVPREAKDFAVEVEQEKNHHPELDWNQAAAKVAEDAGIDQWGMTQERRDILEALGTEGPMSLSRLAAVAQCDEETCRDRILAPLITATPGEPSLVGVTHKHFITPDGLKELDKRGIKHVGMNAMPKDYAKRKANEGE